MHWFNAGHCPAILVRGGGRIETLEPTTLPLGVLPDTDLSVSQARLLPGDKLVIYSDGVSEAMNGQDEQFEEKRVKEVVQRNGGRGVAELFEALHEAVTEFVGGAPQKDDLTLLVLGYQGEDG
jgi:sigma-B regulation protein RsbU (phosphoserine phosphatase)